MLTYFGVYDGHWWLIAAAYIGSFLLPAIGLGLFVPDWVHRLRDRNERILAEREARQ